MDAKYYTPALLRPALAAAPRPQPAVAAGPATAALTELIPASASRRASLVATAANMGGLGLGPLIAGLFAQYAPHPATLVFEVYLAVLAAAGLCLVLVPQTISPRSRPAVRFAGLCIPQRSPGEFVAAAGAGFAAFALLDLFGSLVPSFLAGVLHQGSHAVQGAVVFLLYAVGTITQVTLSRFSTRRVVLVGLGLFLAALALILAALAAAAMALFLTGTVVGGVAVGAIFLGSLATANRLAPPGRRGADRIRLLRGLLCRHDHPCGRRRGADRIHRNLPGRAGLLAPARRAEPVLLREHPPNPVALGQVVPQYPICQPKEICNV